MHPPPSPVSITTGIAPVVGSYGGSAPSPLGSAGAGPTSSGPVLGSFGDRHSRPLSGSTGSGSDGGGGSVQMPIGGRKRYSSNFGHRFTGSGGVPGVGGDSGRSTPVDGKVCFFCFDFRSVR